VPFDAKHRKLDMNGDRKHPLNDVSCISIRYFHNVVNDNAGNLNAEISDGVTVVCLEIMKIQSVAVFVMELH